MSIDNQSIERSNLEALAKYLQTGHGDEIVHPYDDCDTCALFAHLSGERPLDDEYLGIIVRAG